MNTSTRIKQLLLKWKTLPIKTLSDVALEAKYSTVTTNLTRMKGRGLVDFSNIHDVSNNKLVYPTLKLLSILRSSKELIINHDHLSHDAMVGAFCLAMLKIDIFTDSQIEDYLKMSDEFNPIKGFYPDAILKGFVENRKFTMPVELELNQKSETRIRDKFRGYEKYSTYTDIIFSFVDERVARKYDSVLRELIATEGKFKTNFIFCFADYRDFINSDIHKFRTVSSSSESKLTEILMR